MKRIEAKLHAFSDPRDNAKLAAPETMIISQDQDELQVFLRVMMGIINPSKSLTLETISRSILSVGLRLHVIETRDSKKKEAFMYLGMRFEAPEVNLPFKYAQTSLIEVQNSRYEFIGIFLVIHGQTEEVDWGLLRIDRD